MAALGPALESELQARRKRLGELFEAHNKRVGGFGWWFHDERPWPNEISLVHVARAAEREREGACKRIVTHAVDARNPAHLAALIKLFESGKVESAGYYQDRSIKVFFGGTAAEFAEFVSAHKIPAKN